MIYLTVIFMDQIPIIDLITTNNLRSRMYKKLNKYIGSYLVLQPLKIVLN
jgi:hypothetical protein